MFKVIRVTRVIWVMRVPQAVKVIRVTRVIWVMRVPQAVVRVTRVI
jgi:hypothetical protein